ncbi:hypothetical protein PILCRDRAFT_691309 [Piloderma croceum F 1598]|uniref:Glycosyltransferase family 1 protein n=1 Tax=Piloderma croceum (strain F 1598) TaxID=765440 RepID=A0A0C3F4E3_PILCF|nr:hypothetical protein PILCRDRAFT_691309 [Piloderma croceum F 1598]
MSTGDDIPPTVRPIAVITDNNYLPNLQYVREKMSPSGTGGPRCCKQSTTRGRDYRTGCRGSHKGDDEHEATWLFAWPSCFLDYEWCPQPDGRYKELPISFYDVFKAGADAYGPEAIYATRRWLKELEYCTPVGAFMGRILASHGENSLLYMSFGSLWWSESDFSFEHVKSL